MNLPDDLAASLAAAAPRLGAFARQVHWYPSVTSTNDVAARLAEDGAAEGVVIVADGQTAGRGRQGRAWVSPPGAGLYVSIILRPPAGSSSLVTLAAGVALAEGVEAATGLRPDLKWPNDLYAGGRKLAGILAEAGTAAGSVPHVVVGFGINVLPAAFPPEIAGRASSLEGELGRAVDRGLVLASCLAALAARYADLIGGRAGGVLDAWRSRAAPMLGRQVEWENDGARTRGVAEGVDDSGALLVRSGAKVIRVMSGEVRWL